MNRRRSSRTPNLDISPDIAVVRTYSQRMKVACDELHDDPFSRQARSALVRLIIDSSEADAAFSRLTATHDRSV
ncbi:hypothetical protein [Mycolicibacterium sp. XJ870]